METRELSFDTGIVQFKINGNTTVCFNPTDITFAEKVYNTFVALDKKQQQYQSKIEAAQESEKIFEVARQIDEEMRVMINDIFGTDVCTPLYGYMNVYAMADGLPVWCNLLLTIIDVLDAGVDTEKEKMSPRVQKYTDRYRRKYHK